MDETTALSAPDGAEEQKDNTVEGESVKDSSAPVVEESKPAEKPAEEDSSTEDKVSEDSGDSDKELDPDEPISYQEAKKLRNEHKTLRAAKKELIAENEELRTKLTALENSARESLVSSVLSKFGLEAKHSKYLVGKTAEELEKSAAEVAEDLGRKAPIDFANLKTGNDSRNSSTIAGKSDEEILRWAHGL